MVEQKRGKNGQVMAMKKKAGKTRGAKKVSGSRGQVSGGAEGDGSGVGPAAKKPEGEAKKKLTARQRVKNAQMMVLDQLDKIVKGNCKSAASGNYNNARFVLDWSGISEIRTPLAAPKKRKSALAALLKKLREAPKEEESAEKSAELSTVE